MKYLLKLGDLKHGVRNDIEYLNGIENELRSVISCPNTSILLTCIDRTTRLRDRLLERINLIEDLIDKTEEE